MEYGRAADALGPVGDPGGDTSAAVAQGLSGERLPARLSADLARADCAERHCSNDNRSAFILAGGGVQHLLPAPLLHQRNDPVSLSLPQSA